MPYLNNNFFHHNDLKVRKNNYNEAMTETCGLLSTVERIFGMLKGLGLYKKLFGSASAYVQMHEGWKLMMSYYLSKIVLNQGCYLWGF